MAKLTKSRYNKGLPSSGLLLMASSSEALIECYITNDTTRAEFLPLLAQMPTLEMKANSNFWGETAFAPIRAIS